MLKITPSPKNSCPYCDSIKLSDNTTIEMGEGSQICHDCGKFFNSEENSNVIAFLVKCHHCNVFCEVEETAGKECCSNCGLDPSEKQYPSSNISHLWKEESPIQKTLDLDVKALKPDKKLGIFVRTFCGPKCEFAENCPQSITNLIRCFREEEGYSGQKDEDMGKNKRKHKSKYHKAPNPFSISSQPSKPSKGVLLCSKNGWLEERMYDKTPHSQQPGTERGGSGT